MQHLDTKLVDNRPTILKPPRWLREKEEYDGNKVLQGKMGTNHEMRKSRFAPECFQLTRHSTMEAIRKAIQNALYGRGSVTVETSPSQPQSMHDKPSIADLISGFSAMSFGGVSVSNSHTLQSFATSTPVASMPISSSAPVIDTETLATLDTTLSHASSSGDRIQISAIDPRPYANAHAAAHLLDNSIEQLTNASVLAYNAPHVPIVTEMGRDTLSNPPSFNSAIQMAFSNKLDDFRSSSPISGLKATSLDPAFPEFNKKQPLIDIASNHNGVMQISAPADAVNDLYMQESTSDNTSWSSSLGFGASLGAFSSQTFDTELTLPSAGLAQADNEMAETALYWGTWLHSDTDGDMSISIEKTKASINQPSPSAHDFTANMAESLANQNMLVETESQTQHHSNTRLPTNEQSRWSQSSGESFSCIADGDNDSLPEASKSRKRKDRLETDGDDDRIAPLQPTSKRLMTGLSNTTGNVFLNTADPKHSNEISNNRKRSRWIGSDGDTDAEPGKYFNERPMLDSSSEGHTADDFSTDEIVPEVNFLPTTWSRHQSYPQILKRRERISKMPFTVASPLSNGPDDDTGGPYWETIKYLRDTFSKLIFWDEEVAYWFVALMNQCKWYDGATEEYSPRWNRYNEGVGLLVDTLYELADHEPGAIVDECVPVFSAVRPQNYKAFHSDLKMVIQLKPEIWKHLISALLQMDIPLIQLLGGTTHVEEEDSLRILHPELYVENLRLIDDLDASRSNNGWDLYNEIFDWTNLQDTDREDFHALLHMIIQDGYFGEFSIVLTAWLKEDEENRISFQIVVEKSGFVRWDDDDPYMAIFQKLTDYIEDGKIPFEGHRQRKSAELLFSRCIQWRYPRWFQRDWPEDREDTYLDWIDDDEEEEEEGAPEGSKADKVKN